MEYLDQLNENQRKAVLTTSQFVRVIAGAGSGKTRVLTTRLLYLVDQLGYEPSRLCAITFTNKAAQEMKERLEGKAIGVHISTIHALCVKIIRMEHEALGLSRYFTILDSSDQNTLIRSLYRRLEYDLKSIPPRETLSYISKNKFNHIKPKQALALADFEEEERKAHLYQAYHDELKDMGALDFDDLLLEVYYLFRDNKVVLERWQHTFDVILVDEFQDIDSVQYGIIKALVGKENELYVVGDPDQTIYTWRGADVNFITQFSRYFKPSETITLTTNYRSTQNILDSANALIQYNKNREDKSLVGVVDEGEPVIVQNFSDAEEEAMYVLDQIEKLHEEGLSYNEMAILYRSNYLSRVIEKMITKRNIPYIVYGGQRFYDRMEIKDFLSYVRMITHGDDLALRRSVQKPRRGIGDKTISNYESRALAEYKTIYEVMLEDYQAGLASKNISNYVALIESFKNKAKSENMRTLMTDIFIESGLQSHYESIKEPDRNDSIKELIGDAVEYSANNPESTLIDYIQMVSLYSEKVNLDESSVLRLMTVHAAKGLEFNTVFIMGLSDSVFPNQNSIKEGIKGLEEERRLMYVAITRAMKRLYITSSSGFSYVLGGYTRPSRFLKEMEVVENKPIFANNPQQQRFETIQENRNNFRNGDQVTHAVFGDGIIIDMNEAIMKVAFPLPTGIKSISLQFEGIRKKG